MRNNNNKSLFKHAILFFFGLIGFAVVVNASITIPSSISNAIQVIQRLLITDDGTQSGNPIMDINSGGSVIVYGPLLDQNQTPFITGFTETDPLRSSVSNDYYTKNQVDAKGYLTTFTETDPIWISVASNYYTKSQVDAKGYLTSFTELDPIFGASVAKNITNTNISNRNTAYSRGNHSSEGYLTDESDPVRNLDKQQYYSKTDIDSKLGNLAGGLTYKGGRDYSTGILPTDANTGEMYIISSGGDFNGLVLSVRDQIIANKSVIGESFTGDRDVVHVHMDESDPTFTASPSNNITNTNIVNRDSAYSRGDHGSEGYVTQETDPVRDSDKTNYYTKDQIGSIGYLTGYTESDPIFTSSPSNNITNTNLSNRNTAYSRGNHSTIGYLTNESDPQVGTLVAGKTCYASGGKIICDQDMAILSETDPIFGSSAAGTITNTKITNRDSVYSRGNHSSAGYLTTYTETDPQVGTLVAGKTCYASGGKVICDQDAAVLSESDPIFTTSPSNNITNSDINNRDVAYGRGNHGSAGYLTGGVLNNYYTQLQIDGLGFLTAGDLNNYYTKTQITGFGFLTSFTETDPNVGSHIKTITTGNITNRNNAYGRGNHGSAGYLTAASLNNYYTQLQIDGLGFLTSSDLTDYYTKAEITGFGFLTSYTETDPNVGSHIKTITTGNITNRNNAYGRGNHGSAGYLTAASLNNYYTKLQIDGLGFLTAGDLTDYYTKAEITGFGFLTSYTETDPTVQSHIKAITTGKIANWDSSYSRGNHGSAGYLTGGALNNYYTKLQIDGLGFLTAGDLTDYYTKAEITGFGYITGYTETDPNVGSHIKSITTGKIANWDSAYSRGNHGSAGYLTSSSLNNYYTKLQIDGLGFLTAGDLTDYYTKTQIDDKGYITGYTETDPTVQSHIKAITTGKITNWDSSYSRGNHGSAGYLTASSLNNYYTQLQIDGLGFLTAGDLTDYYTKTQIDDKGYITGYTETDPVFMANSGKYYLTTNPVGYLTAAALSREKVGDDIINTNSGRVLITGSSFIMKSLNIGGLDSIYPLYVWSDNTDDIYSNYITIDGPNTIEKGFQIGGGGTSEDYKRAMYTAPNDDGDKLYFANGNSKRDILTLAAGGRFGINLPTDLGIDTPPDGFSMYPQYFDSVMRYDGGNYYDYTAEAYSSVGEGYTMLSSADDTFLLGKEYPWRSTFVDIHTPAGSPGTLIVKYSKAGGTWDEVVGINDTTNRLKKIGTISRNLPSFKSTWEKRDINGKNLYWIQISLSSLVGDAPFSHLVTNLGINRFSVYAGIDVNPMFTIDAEARLGILPPELTGKYQLGNLPGLTSSQMEIVSNSTLKNNIISYLANDESGAGYNFVVAKSKGSVDHKEAVSSEDTLGGIFGFGYDGATFRNTASIIFGMDGIPGVMDMPGKISFLTAPDSSSTPVERMTIKNNGFVGIGTINPTHALTVNGHINVKSGYHMYDGNGESYITSSDIAGHLTEESDPIWNSDKTNYYNMTQVDDKFANMAGGLIYKGSRSYSTGLLPSNVSKGDMYYIIDEVASNINGMHIESPDQIIANKNVTGETVTGDWDVIENDYNETDPVYLSSPASGITNTNISHRNTAYSRGNHAIKGYITGEFSFESSTAKNITSGNVTNRNSAYSRGNHALMGYITSYTETDPVWNSVSTNYYTKAQITGFGFLTGISLSNYYTKAQITGFGYITGYTETDPTVSGHIKAITTGKIANWDSSYSRGNHGSAGYLTASSLSNYYTKSQITGFGFLTSFTELDPIFGASPANLITNLNITNRNSAYGRGNHSSAGYLTASSLNNYYTKAQITGLGYITGYTETDPTVSGHIKAITTGKIANWDSAYGRGNHGSAGYLTSFTEIDPTVSGHIKAITTGKIANWDSSYSRGNHGSAGYLTASSLSNYYTKSQITGFGFLTSFTELDPIFGASPANLITNLNITNRNSAYGRGNHGSAGYLTASSLNNYYTKSQITGLGYITGYTETDPTVSGHIKAITTGKIANRDTAYSRGNHSSAGYITGYTETDPTVSGHIKAITTGKIANWDSSYSRGNHGSAGYLTASSLGNYYTKAQITGFGYLTSFTELDPIFGASPANLITNLNITNRNSAYGRGNHSSAGYLTASSLNNYYTKAQITGLGYLTGYTETDPTVSGHIKAITTGNVLNRNNAYTWMGINSGFAMHFRLNSGSYYTKAQIDAKFPAFQGRLYVSPTSLFTGLKQALDWIKVNNTQAYEIILSAGDHYISDTLSVEGSYPITIRGAGFEATSLLAAAGLAGKPMMVLKAPSELISLNLDASTLAGYGNAAGEDGVVYSGGNGNYHQMNDVGIYSFNKAIYLADNSELRFFNSSMQDNIEHGMYISGGSARLTESEFFNTKSNITLFGGSGTYFSLQNSVLRTNSGQIGIQYFPTTYKNFEEMVINGNDFITASGGTSKSGFDFTLKRDANIEFYNNTNLEDYRPHASLNVYNGAITGSYVSNTWTLLKYNMSSIYAKKRTVSTSGRVTFLSNHTKSVTMFVNANLITTTTNARVRLAIIKNGNTVTQYGLMEAYLPTNSLPYPVGLNAYLDDVKENDYFEIYIYSVGATDTVGLTNLNWLVDSR